jgi:regulator of cell morphogenesis and NO signaling
MTGLNEEMTVAQIVLDHSECAGVFQRYRIDYCCKGEQPLASACAQRGADAKQVLAELEQVVRARTAPAESDARALSTEALVQHLVQRYHRTLRDALSFAVGLSKKVARVHGEHNPKLLALRDEVEALSDMMLPHMDQEEAVLFPALTATRSESALIQSELSSMLADHLLVAKTLEAIRAAADDFALPDWACTSYRTLFRELEVTERELMTHVHLENHVLMPRFTPEGKA